MTDPKSELDRLYYFLSQYYLDTSMLSIPHEYQKHISNDPFEIGTIAFVSALYDFQMRVGLIRSRFQSILNFLMKKEIRILDLLNDKYFDELRDKLISEHKYFHRFDPEAKLFRILLKTYYDTDWDSMLRSMNSDVDIVIAEHIWKKSISIAQDKVTIDLLNKFLSRKRNSPHKRINLFLRWMVRDEYPDLGIWSRLINKKQLIIPLGTEIARTAARALLGRNKELSKTRKNAYRITEILKVINPDDPIKYDFVLSRPVILGLCNKDIMESYCWVCPLRKICLAASRIDLDELREKFEERLRKLDKQEKHKRSHDRVLKKGARFIYGKYAKPLRLVCSSDRNIDHRLRPDLFCDHNSRIVLLAEAKTSTKSKEAPIQLKTYIEELKRRNYTGRKFYAFLIFGKHDSIELKHIIESSKLINLTELADHIEIIIVEKEPPIIQRVK